MVAWKFRGDSGKYTPLAIVGMVIGGVALAAVFAFLFGWVVMLLWNWLMPVIFGLPRIGYWQGWGLVLLSHILVKPGYPGGCSGGKKGEGKKRDGWKAEAKAHFTTPGNPENASSGAAKPDVDPIG